MKLSTKARYGIRALVDLAVHMDEGPVQIRRIAERQGISDKYLWHLLDYLRTAGLVRSVRGFGGGFLLARDPSEIRLSELFQILEGPLAIVDCIGGLLECDRADECVTQEIWLRVNQALTNVLESTTLADLIQRHKATQKGLTPSIGE
jgi:Rrf2 family protein